ncbi:MAG: dCTP deaminase [Candidatus Micrarchaeaceae archaeon]
MILSDFDIKNMIKGKRLVIRPLYSDTVRQNGVDLRLAGEIAHHRVQKPDLVIDPSSPEHVKNIYTIEKRVKEMVLAPHEQVLLSTIEYISVPKDIAGFVELRSTWARHGLSMPPTIIDAGFNGTVTLEVINNAPYKLLLKPRQRFAHVVFIKTDNAASSGYRGHYSNQRGIKTPKVIE